MFLCYLCVVGATSSWAWTSPTGAGSAERQNWIFIFQVGHIKLYDFNQISKKYVFFPQNVLISEISHYSISISGQAAWALFPPPFFEDLFRGAPQSSVTLRVVAHSLPAIAAPPVEWWSGGLTVAAGGLLEMTATRCLSQTNRTLKTMNVSFVMKRIFFS